MEKPKTMGMDMHEGVDTHVFDAAAHPELTETKVGDKVSGTWEGTVDSAEDGQVTVSMTMTIETQNMADREMERMMGQGKKKAQSPKPKPAEEEEEGY